MTALKIVLEKLRIGESPRWHGHRLWFANWGTQQIVAVDSHGNSEVVLHVPTTLPYSFAWLPDGHMLIIAGPEGKLLRWGKDGSLAEHADLTEISPSGWNEIVVDGRGHVYVNGPGIELVTGPGSTQHFAVELAFPNGMAVTPDNRTLIVAESHGRRLTAFDIHEDGTLSDRRTWADLGEGIPDGICLDAEGAVWYADVPNKRCVRVREGGEILQSIDVGRGCLACILGGAERNTLYIVAAEWLGFTRLTEALAAESGQVLAVQVAVGGAGWP